MVVASPHSASPPFASASVAAIPPAFADLVDHPPVAALTTWGSDGYPQPSVVWCDRDGDDIRINTMAGFAKSRNMARDPHVTLLCYDPRDPLRSLEVRGVVTEMTEVGAREHLDALASAHAGRPVRYFGDCIDERFAALEEPLLCRVQPRCVVALDCRGRPLNARATPPSGKRPDTILAGPSESDRLRARQPPDAADARLEAAVPATHLDLLTRDVCGVLTTVTSRSLLRSSLVWVDNVDGRPAVNTTLERWKGRDMARDSRVSLLVVDPDDTSRFLAIRGDVRLDTVGAVEHLDTLTRRYTSWPAFYGYVYPRDQRHRETRVICRIRPRRVVVDAIHREPMGAGQPA